MSVPAGSIEGARCRGSAGSTLSVSPVISSGYFQLWIALPGVAGPGEALFGGTLGMVVGRSPRGELICPRRDVNLKPASRSSRSYF